MITTTTPIAAGLSAPASVLAAAQSEWIKLRGTRFTWASLAGSVALMAAVCVVVALSVAASAANGYDITGSAARTAASAATFAQLPVIMVATLAITGEYASGAIRLSVRATPLRGQLLLAKTLVIGVFAFAVGAVLAVVGIAVSAAVLGPSGTFVFDEAVRTTLGVACYLGLVSMLAIGIGAALRSTVVTILVMLLLLMAAPAIAEISNAEWLTAARDYLPSTAGEILMSPDGGNYGTGLAAIVLGLWVAVAQLIAYATLWSRDA